MSSLAVHRRSPKHEMTMELIISFIRCLKTKRYTDCSQLLYDIRTTDLRDMLDDLGPGHLFYRSLLDVLKEPRFSSFHPEALYNLAVILSSKPNVASLIPLDVIDILLPYADSSNRQSQHRACWCLFGIASSTPETRELSLRRGVLTKAISLLISNPTEQIADICGQIIYGIFHMRPEPPRPSIQPFFDNCGSLLKSSESVLRYVLWSLHFCAPSSAATIAALPISDALRGLMRSTHVPILLPLLIVLGGLFRDAGRPMDEFIPDLLIPVAHHDFAVRLQASRTIADYVQDERTVGDLLSHGVFEAMVRLAEEDDPRGREQAVYSIVRGFGLGTEPQKKQIADIGGLKVVLEMAAVAPQPFNWNLLDCLGALAEEEDAFFIRRLKQIGAIAALYKMLSLPDQVLTSKASNLLGIVGDVHADPPETSG
jgi:hypothetical protein